MKRIFHYTASSHDEGLKIYEFLKRQGYSKAVLTHIRKTPDGILLNDCAAFSSVRLKKDDLLTISLIDEKPSEQIVPVPVPIHIVYEDEDLMVLDKEANQPIHPSINNYDNTLANGLAWYFSQKGEPFVYRCINRLDRDTTGLLIVAKNMLSAAILSEMGKRREIHREYLAIVQGETPPEGTIDAPIARMDDSVIARCVDFTHGDHAVTHFQRICFQRNLSLVSLKLETGRTHQIRVHMKYIGHPLIGDFLYHPDFSLIHRQALHSHRLSFSHPITKEWLSFTSPLPKDMQLF
ncbi:MAG: RluA family pseudouridine synthase [Eubacteriales bacterium]|nr:RluA family pseudouridine synthase [Eubacteriales bacterium]